MNEVSLHSRYNPRSEAERYLEALNLPGGLEYFILIEPGRGYLVPALRRRFPAARIVALHADSRFREEEGPDSGVPAWYPDSALPVQDFLEHEIPSLSAPAVRVIEWRPALALYGGRYVRLVAETAEFIKRAEAGRKTAAAFGRRWVKNFFKNLRLIRRVLLYRPLNAPVIITGSGPGLEAALPEIIAAGDHAFIIAASSSLQALFHAGVNPRLTIATDGGSWALTHLYSLFRGNASPGLMLAASLCAAIPSQCGGLPLLALNDGSLWQRIVLAALKIPSVVIPQRGTVSASAVDLALALGGGGVYLAGVDLAAADIRTHARPYGFDQIFAGRATRLRPLYSQCFARSGDMRRGGSHAVYAAWFKNQLSTWPKRVFSLGGGGEIFEPGNLRPGGPAGSGAAEGHFSVITIDGNSADFCRRGAGALLDALDDQRSAETLKSELGPLLFPGEKEVSAAETGKALRAITGGYGRESHGYR